MWKESLDVEGYQISKYLFFQFGFEQQRQFILVQLRNGMFLRKKKHLAIDNWGVDGSHFNYLFGPLEEWIKENIPSAETKYPKHQKVRKHLARAIWYTLLADVLQDEFACLFKDKTREELDEILMSWTIENCVGREELLERYS